MHMCPRCSKAAKKRVDREMTEAKETVFKNGMKAMKGKCGTCGGGMCRVMGKA